MFVFASVERAARQLPAFTSRLHSILIDLRYFLHMYSAGAAFPKSGMLGQLLKDSGGRSSETSRPLLESIFHGNYISDSQRRKRGAASRQNMGLT